MQWSKVKPCNLLSSVRTFYVKKLCINPKKWASRISLSQKANTEKSHGSPPVISGKFPTFGVSLPDLIPTTVSRFIFGSFPWRLS
ncbi:MAG TPA: hypothetical protein DD706_18580 [Nitrospiraceae bacterium]|nr:hypothetical protein [Nitrospiraceae bacterium]